MRWLRLIAVLLASSCTGAALAQKPATEGMVEVLSIKVSFIEEAQAEVVYWTRTIERPGAQYLRLRMSEISDASTDSYSIVLRDRNGRVVQALRHEEFRTRKAFWTELVEGDYARVEVIAPSKPSGLSFSLERIAFQRSSPVAFSIVMPDDREAVILYKSLPQLYTRSRAVAKLSFVAESGPSTCTGFLIDDSRMLTNQHCIATREACETAVAIFGYEQTETGRVSFGQQYQCAEVLAVNEPLDFSLIKLVGEPGRIWGRLDLTKRPPDDGEQLYMIQHPAGEPKQISRKGCNVSSPMADGRAANTDFGHKCDTLGGSSGSPVLGRDFKVVGLHHFGFGSEVRWREENRAVRMHRIIETLNLQ